MTQRDLWLYITYFLLALFWLPAYFFIIRRGFREKTYGMPIVAMLGNWPWEWIFGFGLVTACPMVWENCPSRLLQLANFAAAFLDAFIVYTIVRFGREKFKDPFIHRYYYLILLFGLIASFAIQYTFISEIGFPNVYQLRVDGQVPPFLLGDDGGSYSAYALTFLMGILFIFMFLRREGLEGQSFIIAMAMLLGNLAGYLFLLVLGPVSDLLQVLLWLTFFVNVVYAVMVYRKSLELGINPWRRF